MDDNSSSTVTNDRRAQTSNKNPDTRGLTDSSVAENHTEECPPKAPVPRLSRQTLHPVEQHRCREQEELVGAFFQPCCHAKPQCSTRERLLILPFMLLPTKCHLSGHFKCVTGAWAEELQPPHHFRHPAGMESHGSSPS